ncbi:MAG TPA: PadR family transcriptional regulator [Chloroflexota bacterium]|nr:PadR family transcriptional regulator [Chloroflexota bacterium]
MPLTRRPVDAAGPARYALLGLLVEGPRHGYDLIHAFAPSTPLGSTIHLGTSHLYALLARLEKDGLIAGDSRAQDAHPPRHIFHITETGHAAVLTWLDEPVARPRDVLLDFPLKLYLAQRLDPARTDGLITRQRVLFTEFLRDLETESLPAGDPLDDMFLALLREARIARTRATLAWLDRCEELLGGARLLQRHHLTGGPRGGEDLTGEGGARSRE